MSRVLFQNVVEGSGGFQDLPGAQNADGRLLIPICIDSRL
jgi:hypothetical protein